MSRPVRCQAQVGHPPCPAVAWAGSGAQQPVRVVLSLLPVCPLIRSLICLWLCSARSVVGQQQHLGEEEGRLAAGGWRTGGVSDLPSSSSKHCRWLFRECCSAHCSPEHTPPSSPLLHRVPPTLSLPPRAIAPPAISKGEI